MSSDITTIYDILNRDSAYVEIDKNGFGSIVAMRLYVPKETITQQYGLSIREENN